MRFLFSLLTIITILLITSLGEALHAQEFVYYKGLKLEKVEEGVRFTNEQLRELVKLEFDLSIGDNKVDDLLYRINNPLSDIEDQILTDKDYKELFDFHINQGQEIAEETKRSIYKARIAFIKHIFQSSILTTLGGGAWSQLLSWGNLNALPWGLGVGFLVPWFRLLRKDIRREEMQLFTGEILGNSEFINLLNKELQIISSFLGEKLNLPLHIRFDHGSKWRRWEVTHYMNLQLHKKDVIWNMRVPINLDTSFINQGSNDVVEISPVRLELPLRENAGVKLFAASRYSLIYKKSIPELIETLRLYTLIDCNKGFLPLD